MKFIVEVEANSLCRAKTMARRIVAEWSHKNDQILYLTRISAGTISGNKKRVTLEAQGEGDPIYLSSEA